jgi:hypothetical protein
MTIDEYADWAATVPQPSFGSEAERLAFQRSAEGRLLYELGDLIFHWACMVTTLGHSPSGLLAQSQDNIKARLAGREPPTQPRLP